MKASEVNDKVGKSPVTFAGYRSLADIALFEPSSGSQSILAHTFLTLCWNLTARATTVSTLLWNNIGWSEDCLTVMYEKGKTHQDGAKKIPQHVYANPEDPVICPILALGLKLCCEPFVSEESGALHVFPSSAPDKAFSNWLGKRLEKNRKRTGIRFDFSPDDISTHSFRKGGATYVVGITGGPDSDAVKLRIEHTLGGCDDIYIRREAGADKYVGRAVAGLDANSLKFSALPPHFIYIPENIEDVIPVCTVKNAGNSLKSAFPFLIASVLYHWEWLVKNLPSHHPFFGSIIYLCRFDLQWKHLIVTGYFFNELSGIRASGIPLSIKTLAAMEELLRTIINTPGETAKIVLEGISSAHNVQILSNLLKVTSNHFWMA